MKHPLWIALLLTACGSAATELPVPSDPAPDAGTLDLGFADAGWPDPDPDAGFDPGPADSGLPPAQCPEGYRMDTLYGKPLVEVHLNGAGPFAFVYDTGAPTSAADLSIEDQLPVGTTSIAVGGQVLPFARLPTYDLRGSLRSNEVDGILGADVMGRFAITLDVQRGRFWLDLDRDEAALLACAHAGGQPTELDYQEADYFFVPGRAETTEGWFLIDSGASLGALTEPVVDQLLAAAPRPYLENFYTPAAIGTFWARLLMVGQLEVGGLAVHQILTRSVNPRLIPAPPFPDGAHFLGVLPTGFLRHFLLTLDQPAHRLRLDAYAGDSLREPTDRYYAGISLTRNLRAPAVVQSVLESSGAALAGVMPGDLLLSINGTDLSTVDPYVWSWGLTAPTDGAILDLVLEREGQRLNVPVRAGAILTSPDDPH